MNFPHGSKVKKLPGNTRDTGFIPGPGRFPGGGNGNPLHYSCLENPMDRGSWWDTIHKELDMTERLALSLHFPRCSRISELLRPP